MLEAFQDVLRLVELPLLDRDINPDDVLPHDTPRADVQMSALALNQPSPTGISRAHVPYFRVAHEPLAEPDRDSVRS